ncbi:MAG TPA: phenylalanine--tRNA ligase subunit alpha [Myxococcaceae bacterium]|nr:phenylalanine--tRNA ligase subunit alpha [Myxococcaceae bacterium]
MTAPIQDRLSSLIESARKEISSTSDPARVEELRIRYLGKKGELASILSGLGRLPPEQRRTLGEAANAVKAELEQLLADAAERAEMKKLEAELRGPKVDVTLPGRFREPGHRHPVSRTMEEVVQTLRRLGFEVATGPEIELDYFNFEALNLPPDHPARDMQDTFYVDAPWVARKHPELANAVQLRPHTSPVQIRTMLAQKPPIRIIAPGRVYRRDSDLSHTPMFHQVEGLLVDRGVTLAELKGTLDAFIKALFGSEYKTRFRPSYFPFTEPSADLHMTCVLCRGKGCRLCKFGGWIEMIGSGMVHPNVFKAVGIDPAVYTGFAWGMGIDRLALLRYGIEDLRAMFENDVRFLEQF